MDNAIFIELGCSRLSDLVDQMARHQRAGDEISFAICQSQAENLASALDDLGYQAMYLEDLYTNHLSNLD